MDGVLIIDKPEGPTSHDVVARARRLLRESRVGHTGTLDPMATGVLPLVLGKATRLAQFLTSDAKRYEAVVQLGQATDTYDRLGEPMESATPASAAGARGSTGAASAGSASTPDNSWPGPLSAPDASIRNVSTPSAQKPAAEPAAVTREAIEAALAGFRGEIVQAPPPYSAKKIGGVSAHRLARRGEAVAPAPVRVRVYHLALLEVDLATHRVTLDVLCSAGFYVRSLAHDLGAALGCGAHLSVLRRTASGDWTLADAVPLADIERHPDAALTHVIPMTRLLTTWPAIVLTPEGERRVSHGQPIRPQDVEREVEDGPPVRAADTEREGDLAGQIEREADHAGDIEREPDQAGEDVDAHAPGEPREEFSRGRGASDVTRPLRQERERLQPDPSHSLSRDRGPLHSHPPRPLPQGTSGRGRGGQGGVGEGEGRRVRLLSPSGALLAIAEERPGGLLHPGLVLV